MRKYAGLTERTRGCSMNYPVQSPSQGHVAQWQGQLPLQLHTPSACTTVPSTGNVNNNVLKERTWLSLGGWSQWGLHVASGGQSSWQTINARPGTQELPGPCTPSPGAPQRQTGPLVGHLQERASGLAVPSTTMDLEQLPPPHWPPPPLLCSEPTRRGPPGQLGPRSSLKERPLNLKSERFRACKGIGLSGAFFSCWSQG